MTKKRSQNKQETRKSSVKTALASLTTLQSIRLEACTLVREVQTQVSGDQSAARIDVQLHGILGKNEGKPSWISYLTRLSLTAVPKNGKHPMTIDASFRVIYSVPENALAIAESGINEFGKAEVLPIVWPYWREFVQSMTVRMCLPALTIPVNESVVMGQWQEAEKKSD